MKKLLSLSLIILSSLLLTGCFSAMVWLKDEPKKIHIYN